MSRILIIEDEEAIADLEKDYLELSGFEVESGTRTAQPCAAPGRSVPLSVCGT